MAGGQAEISGRDRPLPDPVGSQDHGDPPADVASVTASRGEQDLGPVQGEGETAEVGGPFPGLEAEPVVAEILP
jgi:hypothetical protein